MAARLLINLMRIKHLELDVNDFTIIDYMQFIGEIQDLMNCTFSE